MFLQGGFSFVFTTPIPARGWWEHQYQQNRKQHKKSSISTNFPKFDEAVHYSVPCVGLYQLVHGHVELPVFEEVDF
jgi:hypothetical protein